jgi:hypothetical protein
LEPARLGRCPVFFSAGLGGEFDLFPNGEEGIGCFFDEAKERNREGGGNR